MRTAGRLARRLVGRAAEPPVSAIDCLRRFDSRPAVVLDEEFDRGVHGAVTLRDGRWLILLNAADPPRLARFTLAHEVGHIAFGDVGANVEGESIDARAEREWMYDRFAAELLMPASMVRRAWRSSQDAGELAERFEVPLRAMERRFEELGLQAPSRTTV